MRERLAGIVGAERVRDGVAEDIPLPDTSIDAVTVADGFHWFDRAKALPEIRRVLRPGGGLAVLTTLPDWSGASWGHELGTMILESRPKHPYFDGPPWEDAMRTHGGWTEPRQIRVTTSQPADPDRSSTTSPRSAGSQRCLTTSAASGWTRLRASSGAVRLRPSFPSTSESGSRPSPSRGYARAGWRGARTSSSSARTCPPSIHSRRRTSWEPTASRCSVSAHRALAQVRVTVGARAGGSWPGWTTTAAAPTVRRRRTYTSSPSVERYKIRR